MNNRLRIAIIGVRGIPVPYSGFETTAEQVSTRFVKKGFRVTVYCRKAYVNSQQKEYNGVRLVPIPSPQSKNFETIIHSFFCTIHALFFRRYDVILYLGVGNAIFSFIPRLFGIKTILNIDGLDWQRKKWSLFGKFFLRFSEWSSQYFPSQTMTDTAYTQEYYKNTYKKEIPFITNGYLEVNESPKTLQKYSLKADNYIVWMGRIVPDNNLEELLEAYRQINTQKKLLIIGGDHYDESYRSKMEKLFARDKRVVYTGFIPQREALQLIKSAYMYIETKRSGGAHPSLIEAIGMGCLVLANDHLTTRSIAGSNCLYYSYRTPIESLKNRLQTIIDTKQINIQSSQMFTWDMVVEQYISLISS